MIVTETVTFGNRAFRKTYSDKGYIIRKKGTDEKYSEAIDIIDSEYEYIETDEKIEIDGGII